VAGSRTSPRFTKASRTQSRSTARVTTPSCSGTGLGRAAQWRPRSWPRRSRTSWAIPPR
jgi:hypothetical protein